MISYYNDTKLSFDEIIVYEKEIYNKQLIKITKGAKEISISSIQEREPVKFFDKVYNMPQNIFLLESGAFPDLVGRKIMSDLYIHKKINAPNCSRISASMLLGIKHKLRNDGDTVIVEYYPFTESEKLYIFNKLYKDKFTDISFPFEFLDFDSKEVKVCSFNGWSLDPKRVTNLSNGEIHFRKYTNKVFKNIIKDGSIVYDPACSTLEFLGSVKNFFPGCKTIGQDLSKEMTNYAKQFVDEIHTGNAMNSPLDDLSVDVMFLRFLNSEIVTKDSAYKLFNSLQKKVKVGGYIVLFGHTPVLINGKYFENHGHFEIVQCSGQDNNYIFQYYILKKTIDSI